MKYKVFACLLLILLLIPPVCFAAGELSFPDKSVTMYEGEQMAVMNAADADQETVLKYSFGRRDA